MARPNSSDPPEQGWNHFEHVADVGVRGYGPSLARAFEQAALALTAIVADIRRITPAQAVEIQCKASQPEILLVDWLNAVVYEMATRRMLFSAFQVRIGGDRLYGTALGEPVDVARHQPATEVKGATLSELRVEQREGGQWVAKCIVDV
jgi:SHS2 domain-containing protein